MSFAISSGTVPTAARRHEDRDGILPAATPQEVRRFQRLLDAMKIETGGLPRAAGNDVGFQRLLDAMKIETVLGVVFAPRGAVFQRLLDAMKIETTEPGVAVLPDVLVPTAARRHEDRDPFAGPEHLRGWFQRLLDAMKIETDREHLVKRLNHGFQRLLGAMKIETTALRAEMPPSRGVPTAALRHEDRDLPEISCSAP